MTTDSLPGATRRHINVYGIRLAYHQAGAGPPLVLLHGLGTSSITWSANLPVLAGRFTVYALDLPGHGGSDKLAIDYSLDMGMRVIRRFLERVGVDRAAFMGSSMGGLLALRYALERPEQVSRLVLVDSAGLGRSIAWWLRLTAVPGIGELLHSRSIVTVKGLAKRLFEAPERMERRLLSALHRVRTQQVANEAMVQVARNGAGLRGLRDGAYELPRLGDVAAPVLVVWGERDRVFPVEHARDIARRFPSVRVEVLPGVGHWPQMEAPEAFNALALRFLRDESTASAS